MKKLIRKLLELKKQGYDTITIDEVLNLIRNYQLVNKK